MRKENDHKAVPRAIRWFLVTVSLFLAFIAAPTRARAQTLGEQTLGEWKRLEDRQVGYTLLYPRDWSVEGQVTATEFAIRSRCQSVRVVDFEPLPGSGSGAQVQHSFLQVCAKPIEGGESLEEFMRQTYGALWARTFEMADLNGLSIYQTREEKPTKIIFTEINDHRIQIYSSVVAEPEKYPTRKAQLENILASFSAI